MGRGEGWETREEPVWGDWEGSVVRLCGRGEGEGEGNKCRGEEWRREELSGEELGEGKEGGREE